MTQLYVGNVDKEDLVIIKTSVFSHWEDNWFVDDNGDWAPTDKPVFVDGFVVAVKYDDKVFHFGKLLDQEGDLVCHRPFEFKSQEEASDFIKEFDAFKKIRKDWLLTF